MESYEPKQITRTCLESLRLQSAEEFGLRARVLKMGMTQLLDVILHSRERLDVKHWEEFLGRALEHSPEMCR